MPHPASTLMKSQSVPTLMGLGTSKLPYEGLGRKGTLSYGVNHGPIDRHRHGHASDLAKTLASKMHVPSWRLQDNTEPVPAMMPDDNPDPKNMRHPRIAPPWLKHDKQVLRFYGFFQETVTERNEENSRYRHCVVCYFMEDGTLMITEPRVENSGLPQGAFLKRHQVPRADGQGMIGPHDFNCGIDLEIYSRILHITGCDRFTRWFYEENGVQLAPEENVPADQWEKSYKFGKAVESGQIPRSRLVVESKHLNECNLGMPPADLKMTQFLENDRKVLRFKAYWDDPTLYGQRWYFVMHYYLADNTVEINEAQCRNTGRDSFPVFFRRAPLYKEYKTNAYPGMLSPDPVPYMPQELHVGESIEVLGRQVVLYDCDDFTRHFYKGYLSIDQATCKIDVSDPPVTHAKLHPPPHNGLGSEEDSLQNVLLLRPKAAKVDLEKLMKLTGEVLRFEAKMVNNAPEDEIRKFIVAFYPHDDNTAVFEIQQRNSGFTSGKFREKAHLTNPDTGKYFELRDFAVGKIVHVSCQPFLMTRADEHTLVYLEKCPDQYPYANPMAVGVKLIPLLDEPEMQDPSGIDPDALKELAESKDVFLIDQEIITMLRKFGVNNESGTPRISGMKLKEALTS